MFRTTTHLSTAGPAAQFQAIMNGAAAGICHHGPTMRGAAAGDHSAMSTMFAKTDTPDDHQAPGDSSI